MPGEIILEEKESIPREYIPLEVIPKEVMRSLVTLKHSGNPVLMIP